MAAATAVCIILVLCASLAGACDQYPSPKHQSRHHISGYAPCVPTPSVPSIPTPTTPTSPSTTPTTPTSPGYAPSVPTPSVPSFRTPTSPGYAPSVPYFPTPTTPTSPSIPTYNPRTCGIDIIKLNVCVPLLSGILGIGSGSDCCALLGLVGIDVDVCLCAAIDANVLGLITAHAKLDVIAKILTTCGESVPPKIYCPS